YISPSTFIDFVFFFFQAEDGIRDRNVTGVQTCALPISEAAEGPSHGREVRVLQRRGRGPARVFAVLMAADRAVDRVVVDHDGDVETVLSRGGHLLTVHQEVTVAGDAEHGPFGVDESGGDRGRQTEAHRSVARSQ